MHQQSLVVLALHFAPWLGQPGNKRRKYMDVFIKDPKVTAEQIAGTMLCPPLSSPPFSVSLSLLSSSSLTGAYSSPLCLSSFQLQPMRKNPKPVGQRACQPVGQPVCPAEGPANHHLVLLMLFCTSLSIAQVPWCTFWGLNQYTFKGPKKYFILILRINEEGMDLKFPVAKYHFPDLKYYV